MSTDALQVVEGTNMWWGVETWRGATVGKAGFFLRPEGVWLDPPKGVRGYTPPPKEVGVRGEPKKDEKISPK